MVKSRIILQFKITLLNTAPVIWRRIQVPESYTFWDLHVAIQDAMGWLDYHLHGFRFPAEEGKRVLQIGIPDENNPRDSVIADWTVDIADRFIRPGVFAQYEYDFGDSWLHEVQLEGIMLGDPKLKYPKCIAGQRACPPEDCGGFMGYKKLLKILNNPLHPEYSEIANWLKGHAINYWPFDPERFEPTAVRFMDPKKRFERAFSKGE